MEEIKVSYNSRRCKGCHYCVLNCPKKAITRTGGHNEKGYEKIEIDQEKCIACGVCYTVCPDYALTIH